MKSLLFYLSKHQWPALLWTALIVLACSWPGKDLPESPVVGFDKIVHVGMFVGWTMLWLFLYPEKKFLIITLGIAFGVFLEFYQQWLPFDRTFDWWDAAADGLGTILGLFGYLLYPKTS
ncbi:VanZ family protein [Persicitalea sp.]|uniref:VanZ family protein n=1 Tax=Persicitalea sp. TaxID=3100273 RepID=UPI0035945E08